MSPDEDGGEMNDDIREALESMVWQFAYRGIRDRKAILYTGGLSALEEAFDALGWDDPYFVGDEHLCDVEGCYEWSVSGLKVGGLYLHLCLQHTGGVEANRPAHIKQHALDREARRGPDGVLREVQL